MSRELAAIVAAIVEVARLKLEEEKARRDQIAPKAQGSSKPEVGP